MTIELDYPYPEGSECPYPLFEQLRDEAPVYEMPERPGVFIVTRYDDVRTVLATPKVYASRNSRGGLNGIDWASAATESASMLESDAPDLKPKRDLVFTALKPARMKLYDSRIRELADELIDAFVDRGHCDFVQEFARPLPMRLTLWLMGVPEEDMEFIKLWGRFESSGLSFMPEDFQVQQRRNGQRMTAYLTELLENRYAMPGDDIVSLVISEHVARDGSFDLEYVLQQLIVLLAGGVNTTAHFLSSMLWLLIENPEQMERARSGPRDLKRTIEECLRLESPAVWVSRYVTKDTELDGTRIPAGSFVLAMLASANRDKSKFECPADLDAHRSNVRDHMAFGYGKHFCIGAPLARLEVNIAFERIFARLGDIRLTADNDLTHFESSSFRGLNNLRIEFERSGENPAPADRVAPGPQASDVRPRV
jgi:cytochrome P450